MKPHNQQLLQRRKFIMALPVLVTPFVTMFFWALGGGQAVPVQAVAIKTGLNLELPSAQFSDERGSDKLSIYEQAQRDSSKYHEHKESDQYFDLSSLQLRVEEKKEDALISPGRPTGKARTFSDPNEEKVTRKLEELYKVINEKPKQVNTIPERIKSTSSDTEFSEDITKLETMMESMGRGREEDPQRRSIETMLDKILDVQHPQRVADRLKSQNELTKGKTYTVKTVAEEDTVSSFYGLDNEELEQLQVEPNTIEAVVHDTQELVAGATVKMRLYNDVVVNGNKIEKDQFIYGVCSISGERLSILISSIRSDNTLLPVTLSAYDLDGIEGIYIPGAIARDAAKQGVDQGLQGMQTYSMNQSIEAQAAGAGIQAAKGMLSKKAKLIKVTVKAGYKILLKDGNTKSK